MQNREAYLLDNGLIGLLRQIEYLSVITSKDIYEVIKSEYQNNKFWQDKKLFTIKTFYEWLRIGYKEYQNNQTTKKSLLYQEVYRLKNSMRKENQKRLFNKRLKRMTLPKIVSYISRFERIEKLKNCI